MPRLRVNQFLCFHQQARTWREEVQNISLFMKLIVPSSRVFKKVRFKQTIAECEKFVTSNQLREPDRDGCNWVATRIPLKVLEPALEEAAL